MKHKYTKLKENWEQGEGMSLNKWQISFFPLPPQDFLLYDCPLAGSGIHFLCNFNSLKTTHMPFPLLI